MAIMFVQCGVDQKYSGVLLSGHALCDLRWLVVGNLNFWDAGSGQEMPVAASRPLGLASIARRLNFPGPCVVLISFALAS